MKKKLALLSLLGAAGGLLYALESQHRRKQAQAREASSETANSAETSVDEKRNATMRTENRQTNIGDEDDHVIDDQGTHQAEASDILKRIRDTAFDGSSEKLALALGRPTEEIEDWTNGGHLIDGDVVMKARTLSIQRGFEI